MTEADPLSRLWRALRSRRLAVALIALLATYSLIATLVPRGAPDSAVVREWRAAHPIAAPMAAAAGLHKAYASPLFLLLASLLALATGACAVERTSGARRSLGASRPMSEGALQRLHETPRLAIEIAAGLDPATLPDRIDRALAPLGLKVRADAVLTEGRSGAWGVVGSPLFHWSLFLLMVVAAAGQATRAEGFLGLPVGERVAETHDRYLQLHEGPWFGERHTGLEFEASDVRREFVVDGVDRAPAPLVTAFRDGIPIASGRVYPNSPLRTGAVMVHMADFAPAAVIALEHPQGPELARQTVLLDRSGATSSGTEPRTVTLTDERGTGAVECRLQVVVSVDATRAGVATESRAIVETRAVGAVKFGPPVTLAEGEMITMPSGERLRLVKVVDWVRVSVANDWSVPFIYALFVSAFVGLGIAVFVPVRRVSVLTVERDGTRRLHVAAWHSRSDPAFADAVRTALIRAAGGEVSSE